MNKENINATKVEEPTLRITRARAKALGTSGRLIQKPPRPEESRVLRVKSKRFVSDENKSTAPTLSLQKKRRATLTDVTNEFRDTSYAHSLTVGKFQKTNPEKKGPIRTNVKVTPLVRGRTQHTRTASKDKIADNMSKLRVASQEVAPLAKEIATGISNLNGKHAKRTKLEDSSQFKLILSERPLDQQPLQTDYGHCDAFGTSKHPSIIDIDWNQKDPLMCSIYASDIYESKRVRELNQRVAVDYMEKVQRDITPSMRGVLIDWLVEVSEEYKLVPETLYITVNLIDRYLSGNYIAKQKLQLVGVSCMLIASKYEEMSAPQIEEICYITDNTYTREEVLKMEREVLNFLCFKLYVPTIKTFLRRFIHAAQATCKSPSVDFGFLANYLAELTLVEYGFLRFLPSLIAASAVFLARWTLDQSEHPWNPTLEYYTYYKPTDLKVAVICMQELQLNTINSSLNAIREKYRHDKFNCVANLSSPESVQSLF